MSALYAADMGDPADLVVDVLEYRNQPGGLDVEALVALDLGDGGPHLVNYVNVSELMVRAA